MLVLTRKENEVINIGDDIQITVSSIRGDKVRIGVVAPKEIGIHRKEIYEKIKREQENEAAQEPSGPNASVRGQSD